MFDGLVSIEFLSFSPEQGLWPVKYEDVPPTTLLTPKHRFP